MKLRQDINSVANLVEKQKSSEIEISEDFSNSPDISDDSETSVKVEKSGNKTDESSEDQQVNNQNNSISENIADFQVSGNDVLGLYFHDTEIPEYNGDSYVEINDNTPFFTEEDKTTQAFEIYSEMDSLGRCGAAYANICKEIMPTEERGDIGMIKPSGWNQAKYPELIEGAGYLYNRCHLIGYQLAGENANEKNLITGTRQFNLAMLPFENMVDDYIEEKNGHVLYRVTPIFKGDELVARGVVMEALSVEKPGIKFCVFIYNVQDGIVIDYSDGTSKKGVLYGTKNIIKK